ncbi:hypothetical protein UY3_11314 [Chelonia mydas]|uniref:Uncharacterized protein n=1 Tax=Chelonia mydas TaxID=8469 RepID=M7BHP1_CHEMY|nr:hypothetical protein UY3_11314 [Chelonia mydas]
MAEEKEESLDSNNKLLCLIRDSLLPQFFCQMFACQIHSVLVMGSLGYNLERGTAVPPKLSGLGCLSQRNKSDKQQSLPGAVITQPSACGDSHRAKLQECFLMNHNERSPSQSPQPPALPPRRIPSHTAQDSLGQCKPIN